MLWISCLTSTAFLSPSSRASNYFWRLWKYCFWRSVCEPRLSICNWILSSIKTLYSILDSIFDQCFRDIHHEVFFQILSIFTWNSRCNTFRREERSRWRIFGSGVFLSANTTLFYLHVSCDRFTSSSDDSLARTSKPISPHAHDQCLWLGTGTISLWTSSLGGTFVDKALGGA